MSDTQQLDDVGTYAPLPNLDQSTSQPSANSVASSVDGSVNLNIDVNALIGLIVNAINSSSDRGAFTRSSLEKLISGTRGQHNIMVYNMHQDYDFNPNREWSWYTDQVFQGIRYGFWVFRGPVRFVNKGDGGWINWAFFGNFNRNGNTVDFG